jgi:hypothetical protein
MALAFPNPLWAPVIRATLFSSFMNQHPPFPETLYL